MFFLGGLLVVTIAVPTVWFALPFLVRVLSTAKLRRLCRVKKAIVLTYDDGPSEHLSKRLLALLNDTGTKGCFFLLGRNAAQNSDALSDLLSRNHEIGSHTYDHSNAWRVFPGTAIRDLSLGLRTLRSAGRDTRLFRPPYGKPTLATLAHAALAKLRLCWWTIDTKDTRERVPVESVIASIDRQRGGVILMHDLDKTASVIGEQEHGDYVIDVTRRVIEHANLKGYKLVGFGDLYQEACT